jgi:hypothetical protein
MPDEQHDALILADGRRVNVVAVVLDDANEQAVAQFEVVWLGQQLSERLHHMSPNYLLQLTGADCVWPAPVTVMAGAMQ